MANDDDVHGENSGDEDARASELFEEHRRAIQLQTSRLFAGLMVVQWLFGIVIAAVWSPYAWAGKVQTFHIHLQAAIFLGAAISALPLALALSRPHWVVTRHVVAVAQVLWSALFIHLTGGRIETHFHVFGSLAFLAIYRDWKVLPTATFVVAADHLLRGVFWPESVYGIVNPEWWRFLEHAFWVAFEDAILIIACLRGVREMHEIATRQAQVELVSKSDREKTEALDRALQQLHASQEERLKAEKRAAIKIAASVGHELRNPLAAVRNASSYLAKKVSKKDERVEEFFSIIDRELGASSRIIADLLDFAGEKQLLLQPCPLRPLVQEAIALVTPGSRVVIINEIPETLPIPQLDKFQFRQVLINILQNASEAIPANVDGHITIRAEGGDRQPFKISVTDDGQGISNEVKARIFEPMFTTKNKGTGLGLAIASSMVNRHDGSIQVRSELGEGTTFTVELPCATEPSERLVVATSP